MDAAGTEPTSENVMEGDTGVVPEINQEEASGGADNLPVSLESQIEGVAVDAANTEENLTESTPQRKVTEEDAHYLYTRSPSSGSGSDEEGDNSGDDDAERERQLQNYYQMMQNRQNSVKTEENHEAMELEISKGINNGEDSSGQLKQVNHDNNGEEKGSNEDWDVERIKIEESVKTEQEEGMEGEGCQQQQNQDDVDAHETTTFKLFVSKLPPGLESKDLIELFQQHGDVIDCEVFSKYYAFVHMATEESGLKAIKELHGVEFRGCKISVKKSVQTGIPIKQTTLRAKDLLVETFKLYVGNLNTDTPKEYVEKLLEEYGRVVEIEMFRQNAAFVHMETEEGGRKAMESLDAKEIPGHEKPLRVTQSTNLKGPGLATMKLRVRNVAALMTASEVRSLFIPYGLVIKVALYPKNPRGGTRDAIVHLEQYGNIRSAINDLNGKEFNGNEIAVEACFPKETDEPESSTTSRKNQMKQQQINNSRQFMGPGDRWPVLMPSAPPHFPGFRPPGLAAPGRRLIPMPSLHDLPKFPRLMGRGRGRNPFLQPQQPFQSSFFPLGGGYGPNATDYEYYDDYNYDEEDYSNYDDEGYNFTNEWNQGNGSWDNSTPRRRPRGGRKHKKATNNLFPEFPSPDSFPPAQRPQPLMDIDHQDTTSPNTDNFDFSADLPLSSLSDFSTAAGVSDSQDFSTDDFFDSTPDASTTMSAVPFDYSQLGKRIPWQNQPVRRRTVSNSKINKGNKNGKASKKGKSSRRPGLGSSQQQKKFAVQSGNVEADMTAAAYPIPSLLDTPAPLPVPSPFQTETATTEAFQIPSTSSGYQQQPATATTSFKQSFSRKSWSKSKNNGKQRHARPSSKQMKNSEEEQKRMYAEYLKMKPWLYQAIPGTVKKVTK